VTVRINDVNDYSPTIVSPSGVITIPEDRVGDIFTIVATDRDALASYRTNTFSISPSVASPFGVVASSGVVSVAVGLLDYDEGQQTYTIVMNATNVDHSSGTRTGVATVIVQISDVNDNGPVYVQPSAAVYVDERSALSVPGAVVYVAVAVDLDTAPNQNTVYEIDPTRSSPNATNLFTVNATDGSVVVGGRGLDYEDSLLSSFTLFGSSARGAVLTIVAYDASIVSGWQACYPLFQSELQTVSCEMSAANVVNSSTFFTFSDVQTLTVVVNNENDNDPVLTLDTATTPLPYNRTSSMIYEVSVIETAGRDAPGSVLFVISATDLDDESDPSNPADVFYEVVDGGAGMTLNSATGVVTVDSDTWELNYDVVSSRTRSIYLRARNAAAAVAPGTGESQILTVRLVATDADDEPPVFGTTVVVHQIDEGNYTANHLVITSDIQSRYQVTDADANSQIFFAIDGVAASNFAVVVNPATNVSSLVAVGVLDRETDYEFVFTIRAFDNAGNQGVNTLAVTVQLVDVNDNWPIFQPAPNGPQRAQTVSEAVVNATVCTRCVYATDADAGTPYGTVSYSINSSFFRLVASLGGGGYDLVTVGALDVDAPGSLRTRYVTVTAIDGATSSAVRNSVSVTFVINVTNVNDNAPLFNNNGNFSANAVENALFSFNASATDADGDVVAYTFLLAGGVRDTTLPLGGGLTLRINRSTGVVTAPNGINAELITNASVVATIEASEAVHTTTTQLRIFVVDVNDETPASVVTLSESGTMETALVGTVVATVSTTDADRDAQNRIVGFSVTGGPFGVSCPGTIAPVSCSLVTTGSLRYAVTGRFSYSLVLTTSNCLGNSSCTLTSTQNVTVDIVRCNPSSAPRVLALDGTQHVCRLPLISSHIVDCHPPPLLLHFFLRAQA
jgi:hypothetical protein